MGFVILFFAIIIVFVLKILNLNIDTTENSNLEFLQAIILVITTFVYLYIAMKSRLKIFKITSYGFALLFFSFVIRELDIENFIFFPELVRFLLGTDGKKFTMVFLWSIWLFSYFIYVKEKNNILVTFLKKGKLLFWLFLLYCWC